jgi:hypothetical protein
METYCKSNGFLGRRGKLFPVKSIRSSNDMWVILYMYCKPIKAEATPVDRPQTPSKLGIKPPW